LKEDVSAIVLAGGRSSRFGRDKLAEPLAGRTLLERSIDAVRLVAGEIVVVTTVDGRLQLPEGIVAIADPTPFEGPLVGLLTGLRRVTQPCILVVGGDMPTMVGAVLEAMLAGLDDPVFEAVTLEHEGLARPLPAVMRAAQATGAVERLVATGERRLRALYHEVATLAIDERTWRKLDPEGQTIRDIDTPADLG
jgi:molybdenum cofactor guanylyltransferase